MAPRVKGMTRPVGLLLVVMRARVGVLVLALVLALVVVVLEGCCGEGEEGEEDMEEEEKRGCMFVCLWMVVVVVHCWWRVCGYVGGCRWVAVEGGGGEGRMKAPALF